MVTDRVVRFQVECKNKCHEKSPMYVECRATPGVSQLNTWALTVSCPQCKEEIRIPLIAEWVGPIKVGS